MGKAERIFTFESNKELISVFSYDLVYQLQALPCLLV